MLGLLLYTLALIGGATAPGLQADYLIRKVGPHVVTLRPVEGRGGGTGFFIEQDGRNYIISNAHVCQAGLIHGRMLAELTYGRYEGLMIISPILKMDYRKDLCVLEGMPGYSGLPLATSAPRLHSKLHILGHPRLNPLTLASGMIIAKSYVETAYGLDSEECDLQGGFPEPIYGLCLIGRVSYMLDALAYPGNSGSPLVNGWGELVGVVFATQVESNKAVTVTYEDLVQFLKEI